MKIGIIVAMPEEYRAVTRQFDGVTGVRIGQFRACGGKVSGHDLVAMESGMGFENAAMGAQALVRGARPDIIISAGFCGAVASDLDVGSVVVATRLTVVSGGLLDEVPVELAAAGYNFIAMQPMSGDSVRGGLFVSTPVVMAKSRIAALLPVGAANTVVEMEGAAIAQIAAKNGIPFVGIRSVSDPASEELRFSLDELCDDRMRISIPRVLFTIIKRPVIIPQLVRLARNSRIAERSLGRTIKDFLDFV